MGRPTKFNDLIKKQLKFLAEKGLTIEEMGRGIGVAPRTIYNWGKEHPKFFRDLEDWKYAADRKVERSLYERACGYTFPSETVTKIDANGKEVTETITKHLPPDPTSMIFWLKNRRSGEWRDRRDHIVDGPLDITVRVGDEKE